MTINSRNTKAEILAAYKALEKENKSLQVESKRNSNTQKENSNSQNNSSNSTKLNRILNTIQQHTDQRDISNTIKILEQLQIGFGTSVSHLSKQLTAEATTLEEISQLISEEQEQLEQLHNLETIEDETIDNLIIQYQNDYKILSEEFESQSENKKQELFELNQSWNKEKDAHNREIKNRNEERKKSKQRDAEEYQYQIDLARDIDEEQYEQNKQEKYQELEAYRQELEQQWQEKEQAIATKEKEYTEAQEQITEFEEKLRKKIKQGEEEGKAIGTYQAKVRQDLRAKEIVGEEKNYQLKIEDLQQTINSQEARISKLIQQLDAAQKQVQDLAVKAIEGTANRQSYEAMKEIAMEQAKTQQKGK